MPQLTITLFDRLAAIGFAAMWSFCLFAIAFTFFKLISRGSEKRRIHGRPILGWVSGMAFVGSCFGACIADNISYHMDEVVGGMGGFGILVGLVIGNIHGSANLHSYIRKEQRTDTSVVLSDQTSSSVKSLNPYAPPIDRYP